MGFELALHELIAYSVVWCDLTFGVLVPLGGSSSFGGEGEGAKKGDSNVITCLLI